MIDEHHEKKWGKQEAPNTLVQPQARESIEIQKPTTLSEEEAVSVFLEYYRITPIEAVSIVEERLDKEKRIIKVRERMEQQRETMEAFEDKLRDNFESADEVNTRIEQMLHSIGN